MILIEITVKGHVICSQLLLNFKGKASVFWAPPHPSLIVPPPSQSGAFQELGGSPPSASMEKHEPGHCWGRAGGCYGCLLVSAFLLGTEKTSAYPMLPSCLLDAARTVPPKSSRPDVRGHFVPESADDTTFCSLPFSFSR